MRDLILALWDYATWANDRVLTQAARCTDAQLRQRFTAGALPILDSFIHLVSAERRWLARWRGVPLPLPLTAADLPELAAVRRTWEALYSERRVYLAGLDDAALGAAIRWVDDGETRALLRWQGILQTANHGTQHRSEIAAMLTDCGHSPGDLDFGLWCRQAAR